MNTIHGEATPVMAYLNDDGEIYEIVLVLEE